MFEVFLFINPIGIYCYDTEELIKKTIDELNINASFHFVPVVNINVIKQDILRRTKDGQIISDIPQYTLAAYQSLKDYHAIKTIYGNKKARRYIFALQRTLSADFNRYSDELPAKLVCKLGLNAKDICQFRNSNYVNDSINQDDKLVNSWNITQIPTTILFNENGTNTGILVEGRMAHNKLISLFTSNNYHHHDPDDKLFCPTGLHLL